MDKETKREIVTEYKQRKILGGIYKITNRETGSCMIKAEIDLQSFQNRFEFAKKTKTCLHPKLQRDYAQFGADSFQFEILEEIEKKADEMPKAFKDKLMKLEEKWSEKFADSPKY